MSALSETLGELRVNDELTLRCTLRAIKEINARFGNFLTAEQAITAFDFAAHSVVVAAGIGKKVEDAEPIVAKIGMRDLADPLRDYVQMLANGGRPWKEGSDAKGEA